jgi:hypothetical protein
MEMKHTTHLGRALDNAAFLGLRATPDFRVQIPCIPVPEPCTGRVSWDMARKPWQVLVMPAEATGEPIALELHGDVILGSDRRMDGSLEDDMDVNLAAWGGYDYGVSRRHLMLRPSSSKLFLMDLRSTNGTHVNGLPLGIGWAYALKDADLVTLGQLHIRFRIIQRP